MKYLINLFNLTLSFLLSFNLIAQEDQGFKISQSPVFQDAHKSVNVLAVVHGNNGETVMLRNASKAYLIDFFDKNLERIYSKEIKAMKKEKFMGQVSHGNALRFVTVHSPSKKKREVYCYSFNLVEKTYEKTLLFKKEIEKIGLFSGKSKRETNVAISPNGKYFAVATDNIKKHANAYTIHLFDAQNLNLIFKKSYQEYSKQFFEPNDLFVDDSGEVFVLGKLFIEGRNERNAGKPNYRFLLNKISEKSKESIEINVEDQHISSLMLHPKNELLQVMGFYSDKLEWKMKGVCLFEVDPKKMLILKKNTQVFPPTVYQDIYGAKRAERRRDKELSSFFIDFVIDDSNGNTFLIAEEFYITTQYVYSPMGGGYAQAVYHYDDILVLKLNANDELKWGRSIFKKAVNPSYNVFYKNHELYILLNSGKNLLKKSDGRTKVSKGVFESSALYSFKLTKDGEMTHKKIQDNKGKTHYYPHYGIHDDSKFVMFGRANRKNRFMIIE